MSKKIILKCILKLLIVDLKISSIVLGSYPHSKFMKEELYIHFTVEETEDYRVNNCPRSPNMLQN